jgi:Tol biopolymer transport system component
MNNTLKAIGQCVIDREVGRGGMGVVYKARDTERNIDVAIKTIPPDLTHHREFLQRFQQEARALMRLHHPNIVGLIDLIQHQANHYMVLEYVDGPSLSQVLTKGPLPPERAREIALQVCDALSHAHQHNIVHRDIKPTNILLTNEGQVKVTDFGIARVLDATLGTLTGKVFGTARYASPEQVKGLKVDARSDLYSLGVVLYEMLTGRPPFLGSDDEVMEQHVRGKPIPPRQSRAEIPQGLEAIILHCLEKDRKSRYQTAQELAADLRQGDLAKRAAVTGETVERGSGKRNPTALLAVIAVVVIVGLGALAVVARTWSGGGRDQAIAPVPTGTAVAYESAPSGTATEGPGIGPATRLPMANPIDASLAPTPAAFGEIAYQREDGGLWLIRADGTNLRQLTSAGATQYTWTPLAWAPDGSSLAYVKSAEGYSEDIMLIDPDSGSESLLASGLYGVVELAWSPDGRALAYEGWADSLGSEWVLAELLLDARDTVVLARHEMAGMGSPIPWQAPGIAWGAGSDRIVWCDYPSGLLSILSVGAEIPSVLWQGAGSDPAWSPDGSRLAWNIWASQIAMEIVIADSSGSELRRTDTGDLTGWRALAWSPGGDAIALGGQGGLWLLHLESEELRQLVQDEVWDPEWSPDGSQIAFTYTTGLGSATRLAMHGVAAVDVATGEVRLLDSGGLRPAWRPAPSIAASGAAQSPEPLPTTTAPPPPAVAPSGPGLIAFTSWRDGNEEVYVMNADGSGQTNLSRNPASDHWPCWSPDGTQIAYFSDRDGENHQYVMYRDGSGQTRFTPQSWGDCHAPVSPDGTRILSVSDHDGDWEIYVTGLEGDEPRNLTNSPRGDHEPAWSPDGTRIAFESYRDGNYAEIYVMNADGTEQTRLTHNSAIDAHPCWSPDGMRIAFECEFDICVMNADGSGLARLTTNPRRDGEPAWSPG